MHDGQRARFGDDAAMRITAAVTQHHDIARLRATDLSRAFENEAEIAFLAAMQVPVDGVRPRIEWGTQPGVDKNPHQQHAAVDADAFDVRAIVIRRADPGARVGNDGGPLCAFAGIHALIRLAARLGARQLGPTGPSNRHLRRRHIGKAAKVGQIAKFALARARGVIAAVIDSEGVARRRRALQRIAERQRGAGHNGVDIGGDADIDPRRERDRALLKIRVGAGPIDERRRRAGAHGAIAAKGVLDQRAPRIVKRMQAGRLIDVARHIDVEQHQIRIDRQFRAGAADLIDRTEPALEQRHGADCGAADAVGKEHPHTVDFAAVESAIPQRLKERRAAADGVGRQRRYRDLLLVDLETDGSLVFEAVDEDRIGEVGDAAIAERNVDIGVAQDQAGSQREGKRIRHH